MIFSQLELSGPMRVDLEKIADDRGFFARSFCSEDFLRHGLFTHIAQMNTSYTVRKGSIRGLHLQRPPAAEEKLVRVVRGAIFDVAVDCREGSATFGKWVAEDLSAENHAALYIPKGFAHGFQTLTDDVEMIYLHSTAFAPGYGDGIRFDDTEIAVDWPLPPTVVSPKDLALPPLSELEPLQL